LHENPGENNIRQFHGPRPAGFDNGNTRANITVGALVDVVQKQDQPTGALTRGRVKRILTKSPNHPHGIKVMLEENNTVGRVKRVVEPGE
jgi:uncharacterized repeat protein (TIGR03833 family)